MKIVHLLAGNEEGGLENHVHTLCNALAQEDEIHLIAHEKYRARMDKRVHFHALDLTKNRRNPLMLWKLYRLICHIDPHVVHAHANKAAAMVGAIKPFLPKSIRTVATVHSQKRNVSAFKRFDHLIGVSHRVLEPLLAVPHSVVYNGIDLPNVTEKNSCHEMFLIAEDAFVVCAVGRMEEVKNFSMLLEAIAPLDVTLLLVGEGSLTARLKAEAKTLDISHKVHFTGFHNDVASLLQCADLCVISSKREGFSYVMAEALLLQTPVISTDVADMQRILPKEAVVKQEDVSALRDAIAAMQCSYAEKKALYRNSFAFAKAHFTKEAMVAQTKAVYEKVVGR